MNPSIIPAAEPDDEFSGITFPRAECTEQEPHIRHRIAGTWCDDCPGISALPASADALTEEQLAEIAARAEATPRPPWHVEMGYPQRVVTEDAKLICETYEGPQYPPAVAAFIAAARQDISDLLADVARFRAQPNDASTVIKAAPEPDTRHYTVTFDQLHLRPLTVLAPCSAQDLAEEIQAYVADAGHTDPVVEVDLATLAATVSDGGDGFELDRATITCPGVGSPPAEPTPTPALLAAVRQVIDAGRLEWGGGVDVDRIQGEAHTALVRAYQAATVEPTAGTEPTAVALGYVTACVRSALRSHPNDPDLLAAARMLDARHGGAR